MDNKGAAIAMTIVAVAVISVLALLALWIAYMNYYMKVTDMNSTSNFYTAEGVVEQIKSTVGTVFTGLYEGAKNFFTKLFSR